MNKLLLGLQRVTLYISYYWNRLFTTRGEISWVVGPTEVAGMVKNIAEVIPHSFSVHQSGSDFYGEEYDYFRTNKKSRIHNALSWWFMPAILLGKLATRAYGFIYIGSTGILGQRGDDREFEFRFLKKRGKKIICYFTGTDIRSVKLMQQFEAESGVPNFGNRLVQLNDLFATEKFDAQKRLVAHIADSYADLIFNARADQLSYLQSETEPFVYFFPDNEIYSDVSKFENYSEPVVIHAPTNPILKGTDDVRAAIAELQARGYRFEYRELYGLTNAELLQQLEEAHIVLNEFYSYIPGVFGIEAMAKSCTLLTSADEEIETDLPEGSNTAWLVTRPKEIAQNLQRVLDDQQLAVTYARRGNSWVKAYASHSVSARRLLDLISKV